jgi:hypothetical protein
MRAIQCTADAGNKRDKHLGFLCFFIIDYLVQTLPHRPFIIASGLSEPLHVATVGSASNSHVLWACPGCYERSFDDDLVERFKIAAFNRAKELAHSSLVSFQIGCHDGVLDVS